MAREGDVVLITGKDDISQFFLAFLLFCVCAFFLPNTDEKSGASGKQVETHCKH